MERRPSVSNASNDWTAEVEDICERIRINSVNLSEYHRKRFFHFKGYGKYFRIPVIVLASVNATASVGLSQAGVNENVVSGVTCVLGMIIGVIGAVELYLNIQQSMESELKQSKEYYSLAIDLYKTLRLAEGERGENGVAYMNKKYSHYVKLKEASSLMKGKMKHDVLSKIPHHATESPTPSLEDPTELAESLYGVFPKSSSVFFPKAVDLEVGSEGKLDQSPR